MANKKHFYELSNRRWLLTGDSQLPEAALAKGECTFVTALV